MRGIGNRIRGVFGDVTRFFLDEIFGFIIREGGNLATSVWRFFWRDTDEDVFNGLFAALFYDAEPEIKERVKEAFRHLPVPLLPLAVLAANNAILGNYLGPGTVGSQNRLQQESLARNLSTLLNPMQAATLANIGLISETVYAAQMLQQGFSADKHDLIRELALQYFDANIYAQGVRKNFIPESVFREKMQRLGYRAEDADLALASTKQALPPEVLIDAFFRRHLSEGDLRGNMAFQGYNDADVDTFIKVRRYYPPPSDLISWQAREVYEPRTVAKYGLEDELDQLDREPFYKGGIDDEQIRNYWVAHWEHPSFTQMQAMRFRDIIDDETFQDWFRLVEIPPFWRESLTKAIYFPYTRVDVRRMWDLGVVGDDAVIRSYRDEGYDDEHARNLLLFTKVERRLPDIFARYSKGWINAEGAYNELLALGLTPEKAEYIWQTKVVNLGRQLRIAPERDLTKAEIIKGWKAGIIKDAQAVGMLVDLGYDENEAVMLLRINADFQGSPETPLEFQRGIELIKKAEGRPFKDVPQSLINLERELLKARADDKAARESGKPQREQDALGVNLARLEQTFINAKRAAGL